MDQLKRLRAEKGLSQARLAARAGIDPSTVNQIERGAREASPATLRKLAEALDVSLADLLEETNAPKASHSSLEISFNDVLIEERRSAEAYWQTAYEQLGDDLLTHWQGELEEMTALARRNPEAMFTWVDEVRTVSRAYLEGLQSAIQATVDYELERVAALGEFLAPLNTLFSHLEEAGFVLRRHDREKLRKMTAEAKAESASLSGPE